MRTITFRNLAEGHWVNTETGVELIRGKVPVNGKLRWYITIPERGTKEGRKAIVVRDSLSAARRYARLDTVPVAREALAAAWDDAHRSAPAPVRPVRPAGVPVASAPATVPSYSAPDILVFKPLTRSADGRTWYTSQDGRYDIVGRPVAGDSGSASNPDRAFTPYRGGVPVGPSHRRLADAKVAAQRDWYDLCKAHNSARLCEQARLAGDPNWRDASVGQLYQALAEDARRTGAARPAAGSGPRQLSGWGQLRAAHRAGVLG